MTLVQMKTEKFEAVQVLHPAEISDAERNELWKFLYLYVQNLWTITINPGGLRLTRPQDAVLDVGWGDWLIQDREMVLTHCSASTFNERYEYTK